MDPILTEIESYAVEDAVAALVLQVELQEALIKKTAKKSLYDFIRTFWSTIIADDFEDNWHIGYLCEELEKVAFRVFKRQPSEYDLIINVPPGTSKSTIVTIMFPAWCWLRDPTLRVISGSYALSLALEHAVKSRDILQSERFQELFGDKFFFKSDMNNKSLYQNNFHGQRIATSVGGMITGRHGHIIIVDDPIDPAQSLSEVKRTTANNWITKTLRNRKVSKELTPTIVVMQRLHEEDPTGLLIEKGKTGARKIRSIVMPAEITDLDNVQPKEIEKNYVDGLLDPKRMSKAILDEFAEDMGSAEYAGQYLQSPRTEGGNIWKLNWFKDYKELGLVPICIYQSWDTAHKKGQENDPSVCTTWYEYPHGYYLADVFEEKLEFPELKKRMILLAEDHSPHYILIEDKSSGTAAIQELIETTTLPIYPIDPGTQDKIARANAASPTIEAGNVYIKENAKWRAKFLRQVTAFPNVKNDDIVDSTSQFLNFVRKPKKGKAKGRGSKRKKITEGYR